MQDLAEPEKERPQDLATAAYWDKRYVKSDSDTPTHEWFRTFAALEPFFKDYLFDTFPASVKPKILHLGSGDSTIPGDLARRGYNNQLCVDFSPVVVKLMTERSLHGVEWAWADVRNMTELSNACIDVAFDKGTMDAMIYGDPWSPPNDVRDNTSQYMREVSRVLKLDGVFLYVTYRQPHFIRPLLNVDELWDTQMTTLSDAEGSSFDYYGWVLKRKRV